MRTRVKICGLTRPADVDAAVAAGVDALGFVFYDKSPRAVTPEQAAQLIRLMPSWMAAVGLFVNAPLSQIQDTADHAGISHVQLHGDEPPSLAAAIGRPVIRAARIPADGTGLAAGGGAALLKFIQEYELGHEQALAAQASPMRRLHWLFDADSAGFGGSGHAFDWSVLTPALGHLGQNWVLSGGLSPETVGQAIRQLRAPGVDVSSGVEQIQAGVLQRGLKDAQRIAQFTQAVMAADATADD